MLATIRPPEKGWRRLALRPEGTPEEISRGPARGSGRGPRLPCQTGHAPAGHRRSLRGRSSRSLSVIARRLGLIESPAIIRRPGPVLRCPAGAWSNSAPFPGAASAGADLPPANLLRRPSGTGTGPTRTDSEKPTAREWRSQVVRVRLRRSVLQPCKILSRRRDVSRSAAVCAEHQPQRVGRTGHLGILRAPARIRGRCGWSLADTAALRDLPLRRSVFIVSVWSIRIGPTLRLRISS